MTIHLVTVGTTVRRYLVERGRPEGLVGGGELRDAEWLRVDRHRPDTVADLFQGLSAGDGDRRSRAAEAVRAGEVAEWPGDASAESGTISACCDEARVRPRDAVVLLLTDTVEGMLSGFWVAAHLLEATNQDAFEDLRFLDDVPTSDVDLDAQAFHARGHVLAVRVRDLQMTHPDDARLAMHRLGLVGRLVHRSLAEHEDVIVHLSGGYKATLPFLLGIAEGLHSLLPGERGPRVRAVVAHEDGRGRTIAVPLRRLDLDAVRRELGGFDANKTRTRPEPEYLAGYAYDALPGTRGRDRWELTPYGAGLVSLLAVSQSDRTVCE